MSVTRVTAMRVGDVGYVHYAPVCAERDYSLTVSSKVSAISGMQSNSGNNAIYVASVDYAGPLQGVCTKFSDCDQTIGASQKCPASSDEYDANGLKAMTYSVNLDIRTVTNTIGTRSVTSFYGLADVNNVEVPVSNCFGSVATDVLPLSAENVYSEIGVTRTKIIFQTGCQELRASAAGGGFGAMTPNVFASCAADAERSTDFSFKTRLWECTSESSLKNPRAAGSTCQLLPDWMDVNIAIAFVQSPDSIEYEIQFEQSLRFYRSNDHRLADGSFPTTANASSAWRRDNVIQSNVTDPYPTYSIDGMLTASIGFAEGSALEATMTTAIRDVRLCRFKQFCHVGTSNSPQYSPQCTWQIMMVEGTHSPLGQWARNPTLDGNRGCADVGAAVGCMPALVQTITPLPRHTCDKLKWEVLAIAEAQRGSFPCWYSQRCRSSCVCCACRIRVKPCG